MKPLKVAHITNIDFVLRYLLFNQLKRIAQEGYDVVAISSAGPNTGYLEAAGIRHIVVNTTRSFTPLRDLASLWKLYRIISRERFDIVHTHNPKPGLLGQLAARLAGVPVVVNTVHGFYFHDNSGAFWRRFYIITETIAARCSHVILSQNSEDIDTAIRQGISPPWKLRYLGNGIDLEQFKPLRVRSTEVMNKRAELGLPPDAIVVGFVGRLVEEKGLLEVCAAARQIREKVPGLRLLIVGPLEPEKDDAVGPETAEKFGIADICHFVGMRQDMPEMYGVMDVFTLPSHREGFPRVVMEASAMKVPCVVTDIRGCRETVEQGRNGVLVPTRNASALADAILELVSDPEKRRQMGESGREMAVERFDERKVFEKVLAEYDRLLDEIHSPNRAA